MQIPKHVGTDAGDAVDGDVGQGFVPAHLLVNFGAQAKGACDGRGFHGGVGGGVPVLEVRPDHHHFTGTKILAVGDRFFLGLAVPGTDVVEGAQLLANADQGGGHRLAVEAWHAEDARHHADFGLGGEQGFHAGVFAIGCGGANQSAVGLCLGRAFLDPHDDGVGLGLVGDGLQAHRQGAFYAGLADGGLHVGQQHRGVEREDGGVGVVGRADQADNRSGDGANRAGAVVEFEHPHAVKIIGHGFACAVKGMTVHRLPRARRMGERGRL
ncbi:hypothetical protein D3C76_925030 [compost metagenome]